MRKFLRETLVQTVKIMATTIFTLAEKMNAKVWEKGNIRRIYLNNAGYNTKKMRTTTFIWQNEDGQFLVSCRIDCPSQPWEWCKSQEDIVKRNVMEHIEEVLTEA